MSDEQAAAETRYQLARCVFFRFYSEGVITDIELKELLSEAAVKYGSMIGELEVNSIAGENGYKD